MVSFWVFIFNFTPNSIRKEKVVNEQNLITSRMYRRKSFLKSSNHHTNSTLKLILEKKIIVDPMSNVNASFSIYLYTTELSRYISETVCLSNNSVELYTYQLFHLLTIVRKLM